MELATGTVGKLFSEGRFTSPQLQRLLLWHMLKALVALEQAQLIHRDLKPDNILYFGNPDETCIFKLADFGECNLVDQARTESGTPIFRAPEVLDSSKGRQSAKADVWSLFVTMAFLRNAGKFYDDLDEGKLVETKQLYAANLRRSSCLTRVAGDGGAKCEPVSFSRPHAA